MKLDKMTNHNGDWKWNCKWEQDAGLTDFSSSKLQAWFNQDMTNENMQVVRNNRIFGRV